MSTVLAACSAMLPASMMVFLTLSAGNCLLICDFHRLIILSILNISSQSFYPLPLSCCAHSTSQVLSMQSNIWQLVPTRAQVGGTQEPTAQCHTAHFILLEASLHLGSSFHLRGARIHQIAHPSLSAPAACFPAPRCLGGRTNQGLIVPHIRCHLQRSCS